MKFPRLSRKTWIAIGLVVVLAVFLFSGPVRERMENPSVTELVARANAIKGKISTDPELAQLRKSLPLFLLAFTKDATPTTDPAVLTAFESKNFGALKGLKVVDASADIMREVFTKIEGGDPGTVPTAGAAADFFADLLVRPEGDGPGLIPVGTKDKIIAQVKNVFAQPAAPSAPAVPSPSASAVPSPSAPPSSATYSASCSKCSVINNQITCACDVLPK